MAAATVTRMVLVALAASAAGCGSPTAPGTGGRSDRLVDFTQQPPYVNAFDIDPGSQDFLLATNRGFYRIERDSGRVRPIQGRVSAAGKQATVGTFLEVAVSGPGRLVGSGHPDQEGALPQYLGVIRSDDAGRTWSVVSRLGDADLHKILFKHGQLYAYDAVLGALVISRDGGRTFREHYAPRGLVIDFEVDPADPRHVIAASDTDVFRTRDEGATWRSVDRRQGARLAWPAPAALYRALKDGAVQRSADAGRTWQLAGRVDGEPYRLKAIGRDELYLALSDGTILHTTDGAKSWEAAFRP